ncbi:hypothetical protein FOA52_007836 [Chlamydomonas sp. UWO 241]|nr:hypothetical protein FOA52_007836 [Chlamydomonas sp. UWO 241]
MAQHAQAGAGGAAAGATSSLETSTSASAQLRLGCPEGSITLSCANGEELQVDKEMLCRNSSFFSDMLTTCDTRNLKIDESIADMRLFLEVCCGAAPASTYDERNSSCWTDLRQVLGVADKYDCPLVRERCEKLLLSRCLRGRVRCDNFRFQDPEGLGLEWLKLCQRHCLKDLGWFVAYDLGCSLADGSWSADAESDMMLEVTDPELLKIMLSAVSDCVRKQMAGTSIASAALDCLPDK